MSVGVCDLVLDVCELVERCHALTAADGHLAETAACLRAALAAALADCDDEAIRADAAAAVGELDALLSRLDALPQRLPLSA